jgi:hypothetical protein
VSDDAEPLEIVRSATLDWAHLLAEKLEESGIECRVDPVGEVRSREGSWAVSVRASDLARAREVDAAVMREVMPDIPEDFDPTELDTGRCPACQEPVAEGASECAACGLALL